MVSACFGLLSVMIFRTQLVSRDALAMRLPGTGSSGMGANLVVTEVCSDTW